MMTSSLRLRFALLLSLLITLAVADQAHARLLPDDPIHDTNHAYAIADTTAPKDTVKPRLRVGAFTRVHYANASVAAVPIDPVATPGFGFGVRAEMEFLDPLYFFMEIAWIDRSQRAWEVTPGGTPIERSFNFTYLYFPLLFELQIPLSEHLTATATFGPAPSLLLAKSQRLSGPEFDTVLSIDGGLNIFDFGLEGRLGFEMGLSERANVAVGLHALYGQQNLLILRQGTDKRRWFTRNWGMHVGVNWLLQKAVRRNRSKQNSPLDGFAPDDS